MRALVCQTQALVPLAALGPPLAHAGIDTLTWRVDREPHPPELDGVAAVIALGGAANPDEDERYPWLTRQRELLDEALERRLPVLGLCLGAQLLAQAAGAAIHRRADPEIGWRELALERDAEDDLLLRALPPRPHVLQWHAYGFSLPPGATLLAGAPTAVQACRIHQTAWALQFHLEVDAVTVGAWIDHYGDELSRSGPDPRALAAQTARRAGRNLHNAWSVGRAFAAVVATASRAGRDRANRRSQAGCRSPD